MDIVIILLVLKIIKTKKKSMIAVSRGYKIGKIDVEVVGYDFSNFEELSDNYKEQVDKIFKTLKELEED